MSLTKGQVRKIILSFRGAEESKSYGNPSFKVGKKFLTRLRSEDDSLVLIVGSIDERDTLIEADPKTYHITDHYKDYPTVLARIAKLDARTLRSLLLRRWTSVAQKKLLLDAKERTKKRPK